MRDITQLRELAVGQQAGIVKISTPIDAQGRILLVHGLGGDPRGTFRASSNADWCRALASEFADLEVLSLSYANAPAGSGFDLYDAAASVQPFIRSLRPLPTVIIAHSMGGLVAKALFVLAARGPDEEDLAFARSMVGILFLATPHQGSSWANLLGLALPAFVSESTLCLRADTGMLKALHDAFLDKLGTSSSAIRLTSMFESRGLFFGVVPFRIVDRARATAAGIPDAIPTHHDHVSIAKPSHHDDVVACHARDFVSKCIGRKRPPIDLPWGRAPRFSLYLPLALSLALWGGVASVGIRHLVSDDSESSEVRGSDGTEPPEVDGARHGEQGGAAAPSRSLDSSVTTLDSSSCFGRWRWTEVETLTVDLSPVRGSSCGGLARQAEASAPLRQCEVRGDLADFDVCFPVQTPNGHADRCSRVHLDCNSRKATVTTGDGRENSLDATKT